MDRIDAMKVFVAVVDEGSLAGAGRRLRAIARRGQPCDRLPRSTVGAELLHRTTRSLKLSEAGERYAAACRRVLIDLEEADILAAGERSAPRGTLTITRADHRRRRRAAAGARGFHERVSDRVGQALSARSAGQLIDEGIDVALRIAASGGLRASLPIRIGDVRRVIVASPRYLAQHPVIRRAGRSGEAPDHRDDAFRTRFLEFPAARRARPFRGPSSSRRGWSSTRCARRVASADGRTRHHAAVLLSRRRARPGRTAARSCSARPSIRHCRVICSRRRGASPCPRCAPSSTLPRRASSGTSRSCRPRPAGTLLAIHSPRGRVPAE